VTTNYDDALERAFDEAEEPYDLAVYVASGVNSGKFVHVPHGGDPQVVAVANEYQGFPIERFSGELERTIILKIHGAADAREPKLQSSWEDNYVITESDYIDYLSQGPVGAVVPHQILGKLKYSRFLFLGYSMRDWNLRVFLQRIFGRQLPNSWAIQRAPDRLDAEFWKCVNADVYAMPLGDYVSELGAHLAPAAAAAG